MAEPISLKAWSVTKIVHIWPERDRIEHDLTPSCICEPTYEVVVEGEKHLLFTHKALDGRKN